MRKIVSLLSAAALAAASLGAILSLPSAQADQTCSTATLMSGSQTSTAGFTQTNPSAGPLSAGSYQNLNAPATSTETFMPPWLNPASDSDFSGAAWISTAFNQPGETNGEGSSTADQWRLFSQQFNLPASATTASGTLFFTADNAVDVYLNGALIGSTNGTSTDDVFGSVPTSTPQNYANKFSLAINPPSGTSTLAFVVRNWALSSPGTNPTGLLFRAVINHCEPIITQPAGVTVTIAKYLNSSLATAQSASSSSFSMTASWNAQNIGSGSGTFALGPSGFNNPNPYEATTATMTPGATYTTSENTSNSTSTGNVGTSCTSGQPYALVGYTTGSTMDAAASGTPSMTAPNFSNLTSNQFVIVWNQTCGPATPPPTTCDNGIMNGKIYVIQGTGQKFKGVNCTLVPFKPGKNGDGDNDQDNNGNQGNNGNNGNGNNGNGNNLQSFMQNGFGNLANKVFQNFGKR